MDYNGENQRTLLQGSSPIAALEVFSNYLLVAHTSDGSIDVYDKTTGYDVMSFYLGSVSGGTSHGISVASPLTQPFIDSPCAFYNGGCQHICIHGQPGHVCRCQFGYTLAEDGRSCSTNNVDNEFLLLADRTAQTLYQIDLITDDIHEISICVETDTYPERVAYDSNSHTVYWTVNGKTPQTIRRRNLDTDTDELFLTLDQASTSPGICIDSIGRRLYFSNSGLHQISAVSLDNPSDRQVLLQLNADVQQLPFDVQLDVDNGHIYWTNGGYWGDDGSIDRADLSDGTNSMKIISGLKHPTALVLDIPHSMLYWCEYDNFIIERASLDGSNRETLKESMSTLSLAVDAGFIYAHNNGILFRINKGTGTVSRISRQLFSSPLGMIYAYSPSTRQSTDNEDGLHLTTIIIISVCVGGAVLFAVVIGVTVVCYRRSKASTENAPAPTPVQNVVSNPVYTQEGTGFVHGEGMTPSTYQSDPLTHVPAVYPGSYQFLFKRDNRLTICPPNLDQI